MKFLQSTDSDIHDALSERKAGLERWLKDNAPSCSTEQKHLDEGTQERAYWNYGYLSAINDVLRLLQRTN